MRNFPVMRHRRPANRSRQAGKTTVAIEKSVGELISPHDVGPEMGYRDWHRQPVLGTCGSFERS
jgi:hypothetical protein